MEKTKICVECGKLKNISEYHTQNYYKGMKILRNKCRDCHNIIVRLWYKRTKSKIRIQKKSQHNNIKKIVIDMLGGKCVCCGINDVRFLSIDHINNNGNIHRKESKCGSGSHIYYWLKRNNYPKGFQVLCYNCNLAKQFCGKCPHETS